MARPTGAEAHKDRILKAALKLLTEQGRDAVTTRAIADAAKVQPPVLYRLFGDKTSLLDVVAAYGFAAYLTSKRAPSKTDDPVEALRAGWDLHVDFGLANPELYLLMYANPRPGMESPAAQQAFGMLREHMESVAASGRLCVSVARACAMYHAAAVGVVMSLLASKPEERDLTLSSAVRDHALSGIAAVSVAVKHPALASVANRLLVLLKREGEKTDVFSSGERLLLSEWLGRMTD